MDQITKVRADLQITPGKDGDILRTEGTKVKWGKIGQDNIENLSEELSALNTAISDKATKAELNAKADKATTYTKGEVDTKIADLVSSAPETMNTLKEMADALGNDPNFATTVLNRIGQVEAKANGAAGATNNKLNKTTDTFTGTLTVNGTVKFGADDKATLSRSGDNLAAKNLTVQYDTVHDTNLVTKKYVDEKIQDISLGGSAIAFPRTMTVPIDSNNVSKPTIVAATVTPEGEKKMPNVDGVLVYRNGLLQVKTADYSVPSGADFSVSFTQPLVVGEVIQFAYVG